LVSLFPRYKQLVITALAGGPFFTVMYKATLIIYFSQFSGCFAAILDSNAVPLLSQLQHAYS